MIRIVRDVLDCGPGPALAAIAIVIVIVTVTAALAEYYSGRVR